MSPSTEPYGAPEAVVAVRAGHMIVRVTYSEEYAMTGRVSAVARILARWALRAGDVPEDRIGAAGPALADVPPAEVPRRTRTDGYQRPERSLYGAVWGADEHSVIQTHPDLSIPVREIRVRVEAEPGRPRWRRRSSTASTPRRCRAADLPRDEPRTGGCGCLVVLVNGEMVKALPADRR